MLPSSRCKRKYLKDLALKFYFQTTVLWYTTYWVYQKITWRIINKEQFWMAKHFAEYLVYLVCLEYLSISLLPYANNLWKLITSICKIFVDDTSLFSKTRKKGSSTAQINEDLKVITNREYQWKMSFNADFIFEWKFSHFQVQNI